MSNEIIAKFWFTRKLFWMALLGAVALGILGGYGLQAVRAGSVKFTGAWSAVTWARSAAPKTMSARVSDPANAFNNNPNNLTSAGSAKASAAAVTQTQNCVVRDDFNRADGTNMGANWTESSGDFSILGNRAVGTNNSVMSFTGATSGDKACVDVYAAASGGQFGGVYLKWTSASDNLFVKVQDNDGNGSFDRIFFQQNSGFVYNQGCQGGFGISSPFTSARLSVYLDGTTLKADIDTNFDNIPDQTYSCASAPSKSGTGVALGIFGGTALDNFGIPPSTLTVTKTADTNDGVCDADCSLREAIAAAASGDTINFASPLFDSLQTITLTSGELQINKNLTINGRGAKLLTVSGNNASRVFFVGSGANVTIAGLTVTQGNGSGASLNTCGGGILVNSATLTLNSSVLTGNSVPAGSICNDGSGLYNRLGTVNIVNSTINNNNGAAGISTNTGTTNIINSTISNNSGRFAGGIGSFQGANNLTNVTVSGNTATNGPGGIQVNGSAFYVRNSIIANSGGADCAVSFSLNIENSLVEDGSCGVTNGVNNNRTGDPALGALADNGGPTPTHALLSNSPAINAGSDCVTNLSCSSNNPPFALTTDQRGTGFARKVGSSVDIGAFEFQCQSITVTNPATSTSLVGALFSQTFTQMGGIGTVNFSTTSALPTGLTLSSAGVLSGTPTQAGMFPIVVRAIDQNGCFGDSATYTLTITCPTFAVGTPTTTGALGLAYSSSAAATPAVSAPLNYRYSLANSTTLPPGLTLNPNTGAITGTPTAPGNVSFDLKVELFNDNTATGCAVTAQRSINITCVTDPVVTSAADSGAGSLREAIAIACPGSTITFANGINLITLTSGELVINKNLTIQGPGANGLTIRQTATNSRVLQITNGNVNLTGMTLTGGNTLSLGGAIFASQFDSSVLMTLTGIHVTGNTANGIPGILCGFNCSLNLLGSTVSGNTSTSGGNFQGGGVKIGVGNGQGNLKIINSTISGNRVNGSNNSAGGVMIDSISTAVIINSTITDNEIPSGDGSNASGVRTFNTNTTVSNSIIAGNRNNANVAEVTAFGSFTSHGSNIIGNAPAGIGFINGVNNDQVGSSGAGNQINPLIAPLGFYGGPTQTHALLPSSPAINAGNNCVLTANGCGDNNEALTTDQRGTGFNRQIGGTVDIGAVEVNYALAATGGSGQSTTVNTAFANPLVATLTESGNPVSNVLLTFTAPGSGPSATFPNGNTATTNASGQVSVNVAANTISGGAYTVTANTTPGLPTAASFSLTNICPTINAQVSGGGTICASGLATVTVTISGGVAPYTVTLTNGGGTLTGPSPLMFMVSPAMTTTYEVSSATDALGCAVTASGSATVTVIQPPTVANAGPDQPSLCTTSPATLAANTPLVGTGSWSVVSGPSTSLSQFSNVASPTATFTPAGGAGVYTLRWTISNAPCAASTDDVVLNYTAPPTVANAGPDQAICVACSAMMAANVPLSGTGSWSVVSGPSTALSQFNNVALPTATFTPAGGVGVYTLRWTISNAPCAASTDDVVIRVFAPVTVTKSFSPNSILLNTTSTLTINIANPAINPGGVTGVTINDPFPAGLEVDATPMATNTCGGVFTAVVAATSINLSGGVIATAGGSCSISVKVKATSQGLKTNTTGAVSSTEGGTGLTATATLDVFDCNSITCPLDVFVATTANSTVVTYPAPTGDGVCGTITCSPPSGSSFNTGVTTVTCSSSIGNQSCAFRVTVNRVSGSVNDPLVCTGPGNTVQATLNVTNTGNVNQTVANTTTFTNLTGVPNSCSVTPNVGSCTVTNNSMTFNGTLTPGQTVSITYLTQVSDLIQTGQQVCTNNSVLFNGGAAFAFSVCDVVDCPTPGPGNPMPARSEAGDQSAGSVLIYNVYTSSASTPNTQNTRVALTNTHPVLSSTVHLFFVDGASCSVADSYVCLTANQTTSFLMSDLDPGTTGYIVAVATDSLGCPINFNYLIGDEYVKFSSGHEANLGAQAYSAIPGGLAACNQNAVTATLNFDGVSYDRVARTLALSSVGSRADGNDTMLILNRIGGNLGIGAASLGTLFGILYDDSENALSFNVTGGCQLRSSLTNNFPRTTPRFEQFIPAGRTGWLRIYRPDADIGIAGSALNFNAGATSSAGAFNQGHNLHKLTLSGAASYVIPVFPPAC